MQSKNTSEALGYAMILPHHTTHEHGRNEMSDQGTSAVESLVEIIGQQTFMVRPDSEDLARAILSEIRRGRVPGTACQGAMEGPGTKINYAVIRCALAKLSGVPPMGITTMEHIRRIGERLAAIPPEPQP